MSKNNKGEKPLDEIFDPGSWEEHLIIARNLQMFAGFEIGNIIEINETEGYGDESVPQLYQLVARIDANYPVFRKIKQNGGLYNVTTNLVCRWGIQAKLYVPYANALILDESRDEALVGYTEAHKNRRRFRDALKKTSTNVALDKCDTLHAIWETVSNLKGSLWRHRHEGGFDEFAIVDVKSAGKKVPVDCCDISMNVRNVNTGKIVRLDYWDIKAAYLSDPRLIGGYNEFGK